MRKRAEPKRGSRASLRYRVVLGDARRMKRVADGSVHLVVTSPPYWQLKDYEAPGQIGFHQNYEEYVAALNKVWAGCARALHPGCRLAINVGDQFARASVYGGYHVIPIHSAIISGCQSLKLDFMGSIIWQKVTTCNTSGGGTVMGSFPYPRNGIVKLDYEHVLLFRKGGQAPTVPPAAKERAKLSTEEWNRYFYGHWTFPGARQEEHIAVFPEELPRRLIRMFTFPGEVVLDPFLGSGTTLKVAQELGRSAIGYEANSAYLPVMERKARFGPHRDIFAGISDVEVINDLPKQVESPTANATPGHPDKRDAERYGSVVRKGDSRYREEYHRVVDVVDVRTVVIDDGRRLQLVGLAENERSAGEGGRVLRDLVRGQRVYFHPDPRAAKEGPLESAVYLYLRNRTCVNSRLVRAGVVDVDCSRDFRMRNRYMRYQRSREA